MTIPRTSCPECNAGLKCTDPAGFAPGEPLECPKCGATLAIEGAAAGPVAARPATRPRLIEDDEDEADDRPRRRTAKKPASAGYVVMRVAVLGVLLVILCVLGYLLYQKHFANAGAGGSDDDDLPPPLEPRIVNPEKAPKLERRIPAGAGLPAPKGGDEPKK